MRTKNGHSVERELKLLVLPKALDAVRRHPALQLPQGSEPETQHQFSTYYDTSDLSLHRNGFGPHQPMSGNGILDRRGRPLRVAPAPV